MEGHLLTYPRHFAGEFQLAQVKLRAWS